MYSVLRLTCDSKEKLSELIKIGERMELLKKSSFKGLRKEANWFSCSLSKADDQEKHQDEISQNLKLFKNEILDANLLDFRVSVDIALEPEDFGSAPYTSVGFDKNFLNLLVSLGISIEVTVYRP